MRLYYTLIFSIFLIINFPVFSQNSQNEIDLWFYPNPGLPKKASNILFQDSLSLRPFQTFTNKDFKSQINQPVSSIYKFPSQDGSDFTSIELWLLNHVNEPIGFEIFSGNQSLFGVYNDTLFHPEGISNQELLDERWSHLVFQFNEDSYELYENGKLVYESQSGIQMGDLYIQSYLSNEPYMQLDHFIKHLKITSTKLTQTTIQENFKSHQKMVENGLRYPNSFHFLAEPYLYNPSPTQEIITFELDQESTASIFYGESTEEMKEIKADQKFENIFSTTLSDLNPGTAYFYEVIAQNPSGKKLSSGILTFKTQSDELNPIVFALVSDTEARPHINEQVSLKLWDERVDFVLHMGDITDGGKKSHKWEWTQEYFPGVSALTTRIPMVPVAGNGEGDLYWYKKYHPQAEPSGYYQFSNGPADFFMLNSNQIEELQVGGIQYEWLKSKLSDSSKAWKFVAMHHAPYSSDEDDYGNTWSGSSTHGNRKLQPLIRLLEEYKIDIFFYGHLHTYMRTFPLKDDQINEKEGIHYIQVGGMGGNLEDFAPNRIWFANKTYRGFHYGTVSLTSNKFEWRMYNTEGAILDILQLEK